eukprot:CAMPEP_0195157356 /NCGR_PEP_ID=MMETSP0448-20130528/185123_1 /TAXON_ID=66468 /ORGANISM="Heterocapsa triquestra, Strain CCMP 448" /LENGTH=231 /DNA_ID=CAMNT_0040196151 /DNA_START=68 /DNA_END=763 /DNA_ORIENTATION=+
MGVARVATALVLFAVACLVAMATWPSVLSDTVSLLSSERRLSQEEEASVSTRTAVQDDAEVLMQHLTNMSAPELHEELGIYGLSAHGDRATLITRLHQHILADAGLGGELQAESPSDSLANVTGRRLHTRLHQHILADAGLGGELQAESPSDSLANVTGRRLQGGQVFCTCKGNIASTLYCVKAFFNLMLCYPQCPAMCRRAGMGYQACNNAHTLLWLKRLRYQYQACSSA